MFLIMQKASKRSGGWCLLGGFNTTPSSREEATQISPIQHPPPVRLVSHLGMPAGGVTMKMAVVGNPAANSKKE